MPAKIKALGILFLAASLFLLAGCEILDIWEGELRPIDGNVIFSVDEGYESPDSVGEPEIRLTLATEKVCPCYNWSIASEMAIWGNVIWVYLKGIRVPKVCLPAIRRATSTSFLHIHDGMYTLYFSYENRVDKYVFSPSPIPPLKLPMEFHTSPSPSSSYFGVIPEIHLFTCASQGMRPPGYARISWIPCHEGLTSKNFNFQIPVKFHILHRETGTI